MSRIFEDLVFVFRPTCKVAVLHDQEELGEPSQHCSIPIRMSHDSPDDSGAIGQPYIGQKRDTTICCLFFCILKQALVICGNQSVDALACGALSFPKGISLFSPFEPNFFQAAFGGLIFLGHGIPPSLVNDPLDPAVSGIKKSTLWNWVMKGMEPTMLNVLTFA